MEQFKIIYTERGKIYAEDNLPFVTITASTDKMAKIKFKLDRMHQEKSIVRIEKCELGAEVSA